MEERSFSYDQAAQEARGTWLDGRPTTIAVDTETTGLSFFDEAFAVTVAWHESGTDPRGAYFEVQREVPLRIVKEILNGTDTWVFHNAKFDLQKLILGGIVDRAQLDQHTLHDTEAIAHLLDENQGKRLKDLAVQHLGWDDTIEVPLKSDPSRVKSVSREKYEIDKARKKIAKERKLRLAEVSFDMVPREVLVPYAIQDARMTLMLFDKLYPRLEGMDSELRSLYNREMDLTVVLLDVESAGMGLDVPYVQTTGKKVAGELLRQELTIRKLTGQEEFVDHHAWIKEAFTERGLDLPDTQKATLAECDDPLAQAILEFRRLRKLHSTYLQAMLSEQRDGILHPGFRQHGTRTGRMSSGGVIDG